MMISSKRVWLIDMKVISRAESLIKHFA